MIKFVLWIISSAMLLGITFAYIIANLIGLIYCIAALTKHIIVPKLLFDLKFFKIAVIKLREAVNDREQEDFSMDAGIKVDIWNTVKNIIGEKRFKRIVELSETPTAPMMCFTKISRLPCVQIVVPYADENEKDVLEHMILNVVKR